MTTIQSIVRDELDDDTYRLIAQRVNEETSETWEVPTVTAEVTIRYTIVAEHTVEVECQDPYDVTDEEIQGELGYDHTMASFDDIRHDVDYVEVDDVDVESNGPSF